MFMFDVSIWDIELWFASSSIILLITSELISSYYRTNIINTKKLRIIAIACAVVYIILAIIRLSIITVSH